MEQKLKTQEALLMMLYFIFGVIIFGLILSAISAIKTLVQDEEENLPPHICCTCTCDALCCSSDDEVIYTMEQEAEEFIPVAEPPQRAVILSR